MHKGCAQLPASHVTRLHPSILQVVVRVVANLDPTANAAGTSFIQHTLLLGCDVLKTGALVENIAWRDWNFTRTGIDPQSCRMCYLPAFCISVLGCSGMGRNKSRQVGSRNPGCRQEQASQTVVGVESTSKPKTTIRAYRMVLQLSFQHFGLLQCRMRLRRRCMQYHEPLGSTPYFQKLTAHRSSTMV